MHDAGFLISLFLIVFHDHNSSYGWRKEGMNFTAIKKQGQELSRRTPRPTPATATKTSATNPAINVQLVDVVSPAFIEESETDVAF
jgi:hypothetical protein